MKLFRKLAIAGTVATGLAFSASLALAVSPPQHTLNVAMPDGGTAVIRYTGDVAPQVTFKDTPPSGTVSALDPAGFFAADPAFADVQRMTASMDRRMADMMSRLSAPDAQMKVGGFDRFNLPAGSAYTMVSTSSTGGQTCTRSVEVTQNPGDKTPKVVSETSGNCKAADPAATAPKSMAKSRTS
jgi:hypothetical protein